MTLSNQVLNILKDRDLTGCYEEKTCLYILLEFPKFQFLCAYEEEAIWPFSCAVKSLGPSPLYSSIRWLKTPM